MIYTAWCDQTAAGRPVRQAKCLSSNTDDKISSPPSGHMLHTNRPFHEGINAFPAIAVVSLEMLKLTRPMHIAHCRGHFPLDVLGYPVVTELISRADKQAKQASKQSKQHS
jgi:hypothetical protein